MKKPMRAKTKWLCLALLAGLTAAARAADVPLAAYEIGWDDGDGDAHNGQWHTVPRIVAGPSTIHFQNNGVKSQVQAGPDGVQVFKTNIDTVNADLLAFTEPSSSSRHYMVTGEVRWENIVGHVSLTMGVANSNYAGTVGVASTPDGNKNWTGTHDWQPFTLDCNMPPATGGQTPNQFIAEMGVKSSGTGVLSVRNLRLWVYGASPLPGPAQPAHFNPRSFSLGLAAGIVMCLLGVRLQTMRRKSSHERELRRIASIDSPHR